MKPVGNHPRWRNDLQYQKWIGMGGMWSNGGIHAMPGELCVADSEVAQFCTGLSNNQRAMAVAAKVCWWLSGNCHIFRDIVNILICIHLCKMLAGACINERIVKSLLSFNCSLRWLNLSNGSTYPQDSQNYRLFSAAGASILSISWFQCFPVASFNLAAVLDLFDQFQQALDAASHKSETQIWNILDPIDPKMVLSNSVLVERCQMISRKDSSPCERHSRPWFGYTQAFRGPKV